MFSWPSAISRPNRFAPAQNASAPSLPMTRPTPSRSARSTAFVTMVTMSGSIAFILAWNSRQKTPSPRSRIDALPLRSTSPPAARIASSDSARGSVGISREAAALAELAGLAVLASRAIEAHAFALRGDLLADPARHGVAGGLHLLRRRLDAQRVPGLERPAFPAEAPAQRVVDVGHAVGDLAQAVGRVDHRFVQHGARQLGRAIVAGDHAPRLLVDVVGAAGRADGVEARLLLRPVLQRLQIDLQDVVADLLVEALLGLRAQPLLGDQLLQDGRGREHVAPLVVGQRLVAVVGHVQQRVQADDVGGAEDGALGPPGRGAEHHVDLLDGVALGHGLAQRAHHRERADAVGDEVGRVLRVHQPLAEEAAAQRLGARERLRLGVGAGDDLDQLEVAGRVEEVGDAEAPAEVGAAPLHQVGDAQARRVRGDDRAPTHFIDPGVQLLLDRQVFDDGFDHDVAGGDRRRQVVLQVADADQRVEAG